MLITNEHSDAEPMYLSGHDNCLPWLLLSATLSAMAEEGGEMIHEATRDNIARGAMS